MRKAEDATVIYLDEADFITGKDVKDLNINSGLLPDAERAVITGDLVIFKGLVLKDRTGSHTARPYILI